MRRHDGRQAFAIRRRYGPRPPGCPAIAAIDRKRDMRIRRYRPVPGKCFAVAAMPASRMPST